MAKNTKEYEEDLKPFEFKPPKEVEDAQKKETTDEKNLRDFKFYTPSEYQQGDDLKNMWDTISNWKTPTWDKSNNTWWKKLTDTTNALENREKFSYDVNGDALYQQYKDQYTTQGKMAMMDTMGQAAAMTGGYGNSYAQSVGQQTYQGYMQQLTDKIPELWQMAYDKYNQEGQELKDRISIYGSLYNTEYGEHRDAVTDSNNERSTLLNMYGIKSDEDYRTWYDGEQMKITASEQDYKRLADLYGISSDQAKTLLDLAYKSQYDTYTTGVNRQQWKDEYDYRVDRDSVADTQWQTQFDYQKDRDSVADTQWQNEYNLKKDQIDFDALKAKYESGYIPIDDIEVDDNGNIVSVDGYNLGSTTNAPIGNASGFKPKVGDNFKVEVNGKKYNVEVDGKVSDKNISSSLDKIKANNGQIINYGGKLYVKHTTDKGNTEYYQVGSRDLIGEWINMPGYQNLWDALNPKKDK